MILFIKHIDVEGPGTVETYFQGEGFSLKTVDLSRGEKLPSDFTEVEAVVSLGGSMNVYEEQKFPFLKEEDLFIKEILKKQIPFLGICLGAQLLAKAAGAKVSKSLAKEVGWFKVQLQKIAQKDPLLSGLGPEITVFQWHEDTFDVPAGGTLLATGQGCPHQAFKVGKCAYGIQFHIEVTEAIINDWCKAYFNSQDNEKQLLAKNMLQTYRQKRSEFNWQADVIYRNFQRLITKK